MRPRCASRRHDRADLQRRARDPPVVAADRARAGVGGRDLQMALGRPPTVADLAIFGVLYVDRRLRHARACTGSGFASAVIGALVITRRTCSSARPSRPEGSRCARCRSRVAVLVAAAFALLLAWTIGALVRTALRAPREPRGPGARRGRGGRRAGARAHRARHARRRRALARGRDRAGRRRALRGRVGSGRRAPTRARARSRRPPARRSPTCGCCSRSCATARATDRSRPSPTSRRSTRRCARPGVDLRVDGRPAPAAEPPAGDAARGLPDPAGGPHERAAARRRRSGRGAARLAADRVELEVRNPVSSVAAKARSARERAQLAGATLTAGHGMIGMRERAQLVGGQRSTRRRRRTASSSCARRPADRWSRS